MPSRLSPPSLLSLDWLSRRLRPPQHQRCWIQTSCGCWAIGAFSALWWPFATGSDPLAQAWPPSRCDIALSGIRCSKCPWWFRKLLCRLQGSCRGFGLARGNLVCWNGNWALERLVPSLCLDVAQISRALVHRKMLPLCICWMFRAKVSPNGNSGGLFFCSVGVEPWIVIWIMWLS